MLLFLLFIAKIAASRRSTLLFSPFKSISPKTKQNLQECIDENISVWIRFPPTLDLWAVEQERVVDERWHRKDRSAYNYSFIALENHTVMVSISPANISELIQFDKVVVSSSSQALVADQSGEWRLTAPFKEIRAKLGSEVRLRDIDWWGRGHYRFCKTGNQRLQEDSVLNLESIEIGIDDLYITSVDKTRVGHYTVDDIPECSPYFVPPEHRENDNLVKLALIGYRIFEHGSLDKPKPTDGGKYLESLDLYPRKNEASKRNKKADAAFFFVNDALSVKAKRRYINDPQIQYLLKISPDLERRDLIDQIEELGYASEQFDFALTLLSK